MPSFTAIKAAAYMVNINDALLPEIAGKDEARDSVKDGARIGAAKNTSKGKANTEVNTDKA